MAHYSLSQSEDIQLFSAIPTDYKRKLSCQRGAWAEAQLIAAIDAVKSGNMGVTEAARNFNVPAPTLRRRMNKNDPIKKLLANIEQRKSVEAKKAKKMEPRILKTCKKYEILEKNKGAKVQKWIDTSSFDEELSDFSHKNLVKVLKTTVMLNAWDAERNIMIHLKKKTGSNAVIVKTGFKLESCSKYWNLCDHCGKILCLKRKNYIHILTKPSHPECQGHLTLTLRVR